MPIMSPAPEGDGVVLSSACAGGVAVYCCPMGWGRLESYLLLFSRSWVQYSALKEIEAAVRGHLA